MIPTSEAMRQSRNQFGVSAVISISHLSRLTGASCRALRYYEEVGLLRPVRTPNGGRLFSSHQTDVASGIVMLRKLDMSIADIRSLLDAARTDRERLRDLRTALERKASQLAEQLSHVRQALSDWCDVPEEACGLTTRRAGRSANMQRELADQAEAL